MKLKFIAAGLMAAASFSASATTYDLGVLDPTVEFDTNSLYSLTLGANTTINDTWTFKLLAPSSTSFSASQTFAVKAGQISNFAANLVGYGTLSTATIPGGQFLSWNGELGAGTYSVQVTGLTGKAGAMYSGAVSAAALPVPEPETYGMMLGGLALLGAVARRRAKKSA